MGRLFSILTIAMTLLMIAGCAPVLYVADQRHPDWASTRYQYYSSVDQFNSARYQYTLYCQTCHDLHMPSEYTVAEWEPIYRNMSAKISVDDSTKQKIYYYIIAGAKDAVPK